MVTVADICKECGGFKQEAIAAHDMSPTAIACSCPVNEMKPIECPECGNVGEHYEHCNRSVGSPGELD